MKDESMEDELMEDEFIERCINIYIRRGALISSFENDMQVVCTTYAHKQYTM